MARRRTHRPSVALTTLTATLCGLGALALPLSTAAAVQRSSLPAAAAAGPLDEAARILVANGNAAGSIAIFRGDGTKLDSSPISTPYDTDSAFAAGNFVGTRDTTELVIIDSAGRLTLFDLDTGERNPDIAFQTGYDNDQDLATAGDLDADGVDELLVSNSGDNEGGHIHVFDVAAEQRNPDFGINDTTIDDNPTSSFAVGDVDADDRAEVFVANRDGGRIDIFDPKTGDNKPNFGIGDTHFNDDDDNEFAVGDVTGDRRAEVLVARSGGGEGEIDVHNPRNGQEIGNLGAGDSTFDDSSENQFKVGDVDGDGKAEALVANGEGSPGTVGRIDVIDLATGEGQPGFGVAQSGFGPADVMGVSIVDPRRSSDTDEDGIPDGVELDGIRDADGDIVDGWDLPAMGASPCRKDVLVDLDFMYQPDDPNTAADEEISHEPHPSGTDANGDPVVGAVDRLTQSFAAAPVPGVADCPYDGVSSDDGIGFHVDPLDSSDRLPYDATLAVPGEFTDLKKDHFEAGLDPYVHYNVWGSQYQKQNQPVTSSGGLANFTADKQDFLITTGGFTAANDFGTPTQQAGDFMHELGHSLGLDHGGDGETNCKPNYLSVMNYLFSYTGLVDSNDPRKVSVDYSRDDLDDLVEKTVDGSAITGPQESVGIGATAVDSPEGGTTIPRTAWHFGSKALGPDDGDGPLDWNGDGDTADQDPADLNDDSGVTVPQCDSAADDETLTGFNDWEKLAKDGLVPDADGGASPPVELTYEGFLALQQAWDQNLSPDASVRLNLPLAGFDAAGLGVAVDDHHVYATHSYRTATVPATSGPRGHLVVLDRETLAVTKRIQVGFGPSAVALDRERRRAYVTNQGKDSFSLSVVDLAAQQVTKEIPLGQGPVDVAVNSRLNRVYVANPFQKSLQVIDGATLQKLAPIPIGAGLTKIAVDESSSTIWAAMFQRGVPNEFAAVGSVVDDGVHPPVVQPKIDLGDPSLQPVDVAVDSLRGRVWVAGLGAAGAHPPSVTALDTATRTQVDQVAMPGPVRAIAVDADEGLVLGVGDRGIETLSATTGERLRHLDAGLPFSVAVGDGPSRDLFVGDFRSGELTRRSYSSGTAVPRRP